MSSWAKPGVKCQCISDGFQDLLARTGMRGPVLGQTLTVREVVDHPLSTGLRFAEIVNPQVQWKDAFGEACFLTKYFRPLVEQSDDVGLFVHHLDRVGEPA